MEIAQVVTIALLFFIVYLCYSINQIALNKNVRATPYVLLTLAAAIVPILMFDYFWSVSILDNRIGRLLIFVIVGLPRVFFGRK